MKNVLIVFSLTLFLSLGCHAQSKKCFKVQGTQMTIIKEMIDAVNEKDAEKYVREFSDNIAIYVHNDLKLEGREALKANRSNHFKNHPEVRSEIQYLVEIDNKVIMHDKVWLEESNHEGRDIVEVFTFEKGKIVRVDVTQPQDLFK